MKQLSPILLCVVSDHFSQAELAVLSREERERFRRFKVERAAQEFATGRILVRTVLGEIAGQLPSDIVISIDANGKPTAPSLNVAFSLSHSAGRVALVVCEPSGPVGIDIEAFDDPTLIDEVGPEILTAKERRYVAAADDRLAVFGRFWTAKEAVLKFCGTGFLTPPQSIEVDFCGAHGVAQLADGSVSPIPVRHGRLPEQEVHIAMATRAVTSDTAAPDIQSVILQPSTGKVPVNVVPTGPAIPFPASLRD